MMSTSNEAALSAAQSVLFGELKKSWGWLLALGILSLILGTIGLWMAMIIVSAITSCDGSQEGFRHRWWRPFSRWPSRHRDVVQ